MSQGPILGLVDVIADKTDQVPHGTHFCAEDRQ